MSAFEDEIAVAAFGEGSGEVETISTEDDGYERGIGVVFHLSEPEELDVYV